MEQLQNIQYTRKSTEDEDRQVQSHEDQAKENKRMAELNGDKIHLTFTDSKSAKAPYLRSEFTKMVELIYNKGIRHLYVWRANRLARNMLEAGIIMEALQTSKIQKIITPEKEYLPTDNVLIIAMDFGIAKEDIKKLSADVKRGLNSKVAKGWRPGVAPIGYINDKYNEKGNKQILQDPIRFEKVNYLLHEALTGKYSYMDLVRLGRQVNLDPKSRKGSKGRLSKSTLIGIIKNPFYAGKFWWHGDLHPGKHKTMITWDEYQKLQLLFGRKDKSRNSRHDNKYNGLFKCGECGYSITPEPLKKKYIKSEEKYRFYKYWRCTHKSTEIDCKQKSITEDELTKQLNEYLGDVEMDPDIIKWAMAHIETYAKGEIKFTETFLKENQQTYKDTVETINRLTQDYYSVANVNADIMTREEFIEQKKQFTKTRDEALENIKNVKERQDKFIEKIEDDLQFTELLLQKFNKGENEDKQVILKRLGRTMTIMDGKVYIESKAPYIQFRSIKKQIELNPEWLELTEANKDKDIQTFEKIRHRSELVS